MFAQVGLFITYADGSNQEGRVATPTKISIFDYDDKKAFDSNLVIISSLASKCHDFKVRGLQFHFISQIMNIENVFCARTKAKLRIEYVILITIWYLDFAHSDLS